MGLLCFQEHGVFSLDTRVKSLIVRNYARIWNASSLGISRGLIAGAIAITLGVGAGCSSNSHSLPAAQASSPTPKTTSRSSRSRTAISSNPEVKQILTSACFDCHSEEGNPAWYVKIAPSYWFADSAREDLNFTDWNEYDDQRRSDSIEAINRTVTRGEMPPWTYTVFHPAAKLTNEQKDLVSEWAGHQAVPAH
jgi:hypothetical protein